jgi:hypothetical protein
MPSEHEQTGHEQTGHEQTGHEQTGQEQGEHEHQASVNQHKHEPTPASSEADKDQAAPATNEQHSNARPRDSGTQPSGPAVPGDAVRDMMGGPVPQGDVPDAPGTQIAAADEGEHGQKVRRVANAVPGKPDGEVDTRS